MLEKQVPAGMEYMDGVLEALREYLEEVNSASSGNRPGRAVH